MEMNIKNILGATLIVACSNSSAALIDYNNGLIYDSTLDITWLADANLAETNTFAVDGIEADGSMHWDIAFNWIDAMNTNNYLGYSNWRLPTITPVNGVNFDYTISYDGSTDKGFNNTSTSNELSHLFYATLGNSGLCDYSTTNTCEQLPSYMWGPQNTGPFSNIISFRYWTGVESGINPSRAFDLDMTFGQMGTGVKDGAKHVWAVLDGNPMAVPVPAAIWLFLSGLTGLLVTSRRHTK